jgi:hypothetical protein
MTLESMPNEPLSVPFSEVRADFIKSHDLSKHGNQWGLFNIEAAQAQFGESWVKRELSTDEILKIVLPFHQHPDFKGDPLIPREGLTVEQAIERFKALTDYQATNQRCWQRIQDLQTDTRPFFLSAQPLNHGNYLKLDRFKDSQHLFHLDGLHRLIARGLVDGYSDEYLHASPVVAYVIGG